MKKVLNTAILALIIIGSSVAAYAQEDVAPKTKTKIKAGDGDEIIIRKKGDKGGKVTIEFKGDEVLVNGKPLSEYEDENITINKNRMSYWDGNARTFIAPRSPFRVENGDNLLMTHDHVFLGVNTDNGEKGNKGVKITSITENSPAEK